MRKFKVYFLNNAIELKVKLVIGKNIFQQFSQSTTNVLVPNIINLLLFRSSIFKHAHTHTP